VRIADHCLASEDRGLGKTIAYRPLRSSAFAANDKAVFVTTLVWPRICADAGIAETARLVAALQKRTQMTPYAPDHFATLDRAQAAPCSWPRLTPSLTARETVRGVSETDVEQATQSEGVQHDQPKEEPRRRGESRPFAPRARIVDDHGADRSL
jgi:hypothetical protein